MEENPWEAAFDQPNVATLEKEEETEPEKFSLDLMGLLNVGKLTEEINIYGRKVVIQTLKMGEELEIGLLAKQYAETETQDNAIICATVAACVVSVDGQPVYRALGPNDSVIQAKFDFIKENWYWPVVRTIYLKYIDLRTRSEEASQELTKK